MDKLSDPAIVDRRSHGTHGSHGSYSLIDPIGLMHPNCSKSAVPEDKHDDEYENTPSPHRQVQGNCGYKDDADERVALEERLIDPLQVELGRRPMLIEQGPADQQQRAKVDPAKSADIAKANET